VSACTHSGVSLQSALPPSTCAGVTVYVALIAMQPPAHSACQDVEGGEEREDRPPQLSEDATDVYDEHLGDASAASMLLSPSMTATAYHKWRFRINS
jgi:hypothetical protein